MGALPYATCFGLPCCNLSCHEIALLKATLLRPFCPSVPRTALLLTFLSYHVMPYATLTLLALLHSTSPYAALPCFALPSCLLSCATLTCLALLFLPYPASPCAALLWFVSLCLASQCPTLRFLALLFALSCYAFYLRCFSLPLFLNSCIACPAMPCASLSCPPPLLLYAALSWSALPCHVIRLTILPRSVLHCIALLYFLLCPYMLLPALSCFS